MTTSLPAGLGRGAGAGLAATGAMSVVMLAADKAGLMGKHPPQHITDRLLHRAGSRPPRPVRRLLGTTAHVAFGAGTGAAYGALRGQGWLPGPPAATGITSGLGVWAASYAGWLPALGVLPPPHRNRPGRPASMVAAHVVYGAVLGTLVGRAEQH